MGLFSKLRGEFIDIIEWLDSTNDTIVYRFERHNNEIKMGAKLTVRPGQMAVFVNEGQVADIFSPGMHELSTNNLPILSTLKGWSYGFNSPFKAEVYFFSTRVFTNLKWGTSKPITLRDSELGPIRLRAYGNYSIRVESPTQFLQELVSTDGLFQVDEVSAHLRNIIVNAFAKWVGSSQIPLLDLAAHYGDLGDNIRQAIQPDMGSVGIELTNLLIENISLPSAVEEALDKRASMGLLGNMQQYTQFQTANAIEQSAQNSDSSNPGLEFGMGMMMAQQMTSAMQQPQTQVAPPNSTQPTPPPLPPQWYIYENGQQLGPLDWQQLSQRRLTPQTLVWRDGMSSWLPAAQVSELSSLLAPPTPPTPPAPPTSPTPPAPPASAPVPSSVDKAEWYIFRSGESTGPFTLEQLRQQGVSPRTNIRKEGEEEWTRARDIPELQSIIE